MGLGFSEACMNGIDGLESWCLMALLDFEVSHAKSYVLRFQGLQDLGFRVQD